MTEFFEALLRIIVEVIVEIIIKLFNFKARSIGQNIIVLLFLFVIGAGVFLLFI